MSSKSGPLVGVVVALLIIAALGSIGYYQLEVAPRQTSISTSTAATAINCLTSHTCVNVTIVSGASSQPSGYAAGQTTTFGYNPDTITLVIGTNNTVVWTNEDSAAFHTATDAGIFDSGCVGPACTTPVSSYQFTFTVAGTYHYSCTYHPWMQGTVIVKNG